MNKVIKGTIAAAAAVALFGGGAGSLAYWQATESTDKLEVSTGWVQLLDGPATYNLNGTSITYAELQADRIVPGDVLTYEHIFTIDVYSTDAVLTVPEPDWSSSFGPMVDVLETDVSVTNISSGMGLDLAPTTTAGSYNVEGRGGIRVTVTITVPSDLEDSETMLNSIVLEPLELTVSQVAAPLPEPVP